MTHEQGTRLSLVRLPADLFPSDCQGEVIEVGRYPDRVILPGADGVFTRLITVYRCLRCEGRISVDRAAGRILNHYQGPTLDVEAILGLAAREGGGR